MFLFVVITSSGLQSSQMLLFGAFIEYCISHSYNSLSLPLSGTIAALIVVTLLVFVLVVTVVVCVVVKRNRRRNNSTSDCNSRQACGESLVVKVSSATGGNGRLIIKWIVINYE